MLSWVPEQRGRTTPDGDSAPTLQGAIQAQLGLRLESKKSMVDVLVVDRAENSPPGIKPEVARACAPCLIRVINGDLADAVSTAHKSEMPTFRPRDPRESDIWDKTTNSKSEYHRPPTAVAEPLKQ